MREPITGTIISLGFAAGGIQVSVKPDEGQAPEGGSFIQASWWIGNSYHVRQAAGLSRSADWEEAKGKKVVVHFNRDDQPQRLAPPPKLIESDPILRRSIESEAAVPELRDWAWDLLQTGWEMERQIYDQAEGTGKRQVPSRMDKRIMDALRQVGQLTSTLREIACDTAEYTKTDEGRWEKVHLGAEAGTYQYDPPYIVKGGRIIPKENNHE